MKRDVALKVVKKSTVKSLSRDVIALEVDILRDLNHRNVVRILHTSLAFATYLMSFCVDQILRHV